MTYDVVILGAGPGGYVGAIRAAQLGLKVALVEKEHLGGVCLNWGCIPTKALLKSAEVYHTLQEAASFGVTVKGTIKPDLAAMVERSRAISGQLTKGIEFLMKKNNVPVIQGIGRFLSQKNDIKIIEVKDKAGKSQTLETKNLVIATGASARHLPEGEKYPTHFWTAKQAMVPETLPESLLILGSGAIGIEFACFYNALGTKVTVVELKERILPQEDGEISALAKKTFEKQGIQIFTNSETKDIKVQKGKISTTLIHPKGTETLSVDKVLVAIGITPNTQDLGLDKTKVQLDRGHIVVDGFCQTQEPGIYAIGDVVAGPWLAHKASHEATLVMEKIAGQVVHPLDRRHIPGCTYSFPQIASVGLTEDAVKSQKIDYKVGRFSYAGNGKALAMGEKEGLIKTLFDTKTGAILGAHMIGAEVTELIPTLCLALTMEATEAELMTTIFPHPTLSEMIHESALAAFGKPLHS